MNDIKLTNEQAVWLRDHLLQMVNDRAWGNESIDDAHEHAQTIHAKLVKSIDSKKW